MGTRKLAGWMTLFLEQRMCKNAQETQILVNSAEQAKILGDCTVNRDVC